MVDIINAPSFSCHFYQKVTNIMFCVLNFLEINLLQYIRILDYNRFFYEYDLDFFLNNLLCYGYYTVWMFQSFILFRIIVCPAKISLAGNFLHPVSLYIRLATHWYLMYSCPIIIIILMLLREQWNFFFIFNFCQNFSSNLFSIT